LKKQVSTLDIRVLIAIMKEKGHSYKFYYSDNSYSMKITRKGRGEPQEITRGERAPVLSLRDAMNRLFEESFWDPFDAFDRVPVPDLHQAGRGFFPKVDVAESDKEIVVTADVPGIDPENVDIEVEEDSLIISGSTQKESKDEDAEKKYYRYEREYGEFRREITLPARVKPEEVSAKTKNGVLEIMLPKVKIEKKAKVKVKAE